MNTFLAEPLALRNLGIFKQHDNKNKVITIAENYNLSTSQVRRILKRERPAEQREFKLHLADKTHVIPLGAVISCSFGGAAKFIERHHRATIEKLELRHQWFIRCDETGNAISLAELTDK